MGRKNTFYTLNDLLKFILPRSKNTIEYVKRKCELFGDINKKRDSPQCVSKLRRMKKSCTIYFAIEREGRICACVI